MMKVAALLLCAVAVMGDSVAYGPTKKIIEDNMELWHRFIRKGEEMPLLNSFTPDARVCFNGQCGGRDMVLGFKNDQFKFFQIRIDEESVYMKDTFHVVWVSTAELGRCEGVLTGIYAGYLNKEGKIKELHQWFNQELMDKFYGHECIGKITDEF